MILVYDEMSKFELQNPKKKATFLQNLIFKIEKILLQNTSGTIPFVNSSILYLLSLSVLIQFPIR